MIRLHYATGPKPGNLGDVLSPVVLRGLGLDVQHAEPARAELLAIGSILRHSKPHHTVWGSGILRPSDTPNPKARYLAVRGPISRDAVLRAGGTCPEVYGDPALLLPLVHDTSVDTRYRLGVVPHYRDVQNGVLTPRGLGPVYVINPLTSPADALRKVDAIRQCEAIVSSSLHGIVIAHAYGIPAAWLKTDGPVGDGVKFRDYAAGVGMELVPYTRIEDAVPVLPPLLDPDPLLNALKVLRRKEAVAA